MTSPCIKARQELSKRILDRVGNAYKFNKCFSLDLNVKKLLIQYGKIKVHWILLISA